MSITFAEIAAYLPALLMLLAKVLSDIAANATVKHNARLSRIVNMATREAGTIALALMASPAANVEDLKRALITTSAQKIAETMSDSVAAVGGNQDQVAGIVKGEVDKLMTTAMSTMVKPPIPVNPGVPPIPLVPPSL